MYFASTIGVGTRLPAHATAAGRVLLSGLPIAEVVELYDDVELAPVTKQTPTSIGDIIEQIDRDKKTGYVVSWGYFDSKVSSIAAPIYDQSGTPIAAVSVSCPLGNYPRDEFESRVKKQTLHAADEMSQAMGYWGTEQNR